MLDILTSQSYSRLKPRHLFQDMTATNASATSSSTWATPARKQHLQFPGQIFNLAKFRFDYQK